MSSQVSEDRQMQHQAQTAEWIVRTFAAALFLFTTLMAAGWFLALLNEQPVILPLSLFVAGTVSSCILASAKPPQS